MNGIQVALPALPSRADPRGGEPLARLLDVTVPTGDVRGGLTDELIAGYDGDLSIPLRPDRPAVVANFVETLDGAVALDRAGRTGGGEVSGFSPTDRFVMGLLRAMADVILVGAATVRSSPRTAWTPGAVFPPAAPDYEALRAHLGLSPVPVTLIATATGDLDLDEPVFAGRRQRVVIAGPASAIARLRRRRLPSGVEIEALPHAGVTGIRELVELAGRLGARVVLSEAGPHLFAELLRAGRVDELFLTLSPQLVGRARPDDRLALVEGGTLWPDRPRWSRLRSVRRAGDHLFLRYSFEESD